MVRRAMSILDFVEMVMVVEEVFGIEIPDVNAVGFNSPREIVDWLEPRLRNKRLNEGSAALLRKLAEHQQSPDLAEGFGGTWRREQIAVVVREIFRVHSSDDSSDPTDPDAPIRVPIKPKPHPRSGAARALPDEQQ